MNHVTRLIRVGTGWMTEAPRALTSLGILRSTVGLVSLAYCLTCAGDRHFLFGGDGLFGRDALIDELRRTRSWSLFVLFPDGPAFELLYLALILTSVAALLGLGGRFALGAHWILLWSLYAANPTLMDGGDNLVVLLTPFLMLTRCYERIRLGRPRCARRSLIGNTSNNLGVLLIAAQACMVYLLAGLYKVQGELWQDGTALYYILRIPEFYLPGVTDWILEFGWALVAAAYATVLTSVFFTPLVLFRNGRPWAVGIMMLFHIAIAVLMGLTSFALIMIAMDLIFVNGHADRICGRLARVIRGERSAMFARRGALSRGSISGGNRAC